MQTRLHSCYSFSDSSAIANLTTQRRFNRTLPGKQCVIIRNGNPAVIVSRLVANRLSVGGEMFFFFFVNNTVKASA